ncbi:uncharacterized protein LOC120272459 isoform X2 [Dioscorea cayenensis subsp. rotundata]|uniref:Uncharacterized protein LOC120272459 isoform X2 n=1 Tax=Dioscorea cayennensis subsp. rotundata TaxID=55577 RepID=A0AB40C7A3_DIOCR|nr:uncharacterized protein LOC120272459 isoform X2 [Dioscorea cayenensis subsp. rotundata]
MKLAMRSRRAVTVRSTMSRSPWTEEMHSSFLNWMEDSFVLGSLLGLTAPEHERCACSSWPRFPDFSFSDSHTVSHHPFPVLGNANHGGGGNRGRKRPVCDDDEAQDQVVPELRKKGNEADGLGGRRKRRSLC